MSHAHEQISLLTICGTFAPPSLEAARRVHNQTAGAPEGVVAARVLGDLSHMVYSDTEVSWRLKHTDEGGNR